LHATARSRRSATGRVDPAARPPVVGGAVGDLDARRAVHLGGERRSGAPARLGRAATRLAGLAPDDRRDAAVGRALLAAGAAAGVGAGPFVGGAAVVGVVVVPVVLAARRRARRHAAAQDEAPEVVELVRLGIGAGLNVRLALEGVTRHLDGVVAAELRLALARADRGERLADALDGIEVGGDGIRLLVDALVASERDGAPLDDALARVAADARTARRRRAEEAARRAPVQLLFPLVFCTLPAFVLLTVVPVLLRSLPTLAP
jgi:tight adherence protein C